MNALPSLGITVLRRNGEPVVSTFKSREPQVARVSLVDSAHSKKYIAETT